MNPAKILRVDEAVTASVMRLPSGRSVEADVDERITVRSPTGRVELAVRFTADGPVLSFHGADVELTATRAVRVDCERFEVRARDGIAMQTDGDLSHDALGAVELAGDRARIVARDGALTLDARDDVQVDGARVLLNCADVGERERP